MDGAADIEARVRADLEQLPSLVVGFSGGVDSAVLADLASQALGERALIATAVSPSLPSEEREEARDVAARRGWRHVEVPTHEMDDENYVANTPARCFFCRSAFFEALTPFREERGIEHLALGTLADDLGDHRPGQDAARQAGVLTPLADAGARKAHVREIARVRALEVWDKPASACLSSRIPYGTAVTVEALDRVARAERALKGMGFETCRVRDHERCARVEIPDDRLEEALRRRGDIVDALRHAGYAWVSLDLDGFASGSMNRVLPMAGQGATQ